MLALFFGLSGVGKSTLIEILVSHHRWKVIPTTMTRNPREGETDKISVSEQDFTQMLDDGRFLITNNSYGYMYGTPLVDVEQAVQDRNSMWVIDFPYYRRSIFDPYQHIEFMILPENEDQLVQQIHRGGRASRLNNIIAEYRESLTQLDKDKGLGTCPIIITNRRDRANDAVKDILSHINKHI